MTEADIQPELDAIKSIVAALQPLNETARQWALKCAIDRLGIEFTGGRAAGTGEGESQNAASGDSVSSDQEVVDIRAFKQEKNPKSDVQMAAVVAYYLAKRAPQELRRDSIMADDIQKYFDQAGYRLPKNSTMTLVNAKNAGYLDAAGKGKYKLNPVGHNLVVHNLPKSDASKPVKRSRAKRASRKNTAGRRATKASSTKAG